MPTDQMTGLTIPGGMRGVSHFKRELRNSVGDIFEFSRVDSVDDGYTIYADPKYEYFEYSYYLRCRPRTLGRGVEYRIYRKSNNEQ